MKTICLHDKERIEAFLRRNTPLNIYPIGDLDDHFWPHTTWYGLLDGDDIKAIALLYSGYDMPTLLIFGSDDDLPLLKQLLGSIGHLLPRHFYSHLGAGSVAAMGDGWEVTNNGKHYKLLLADEAKLAAIDTSTAVPLGRADADEVQAFYESADLKDWYAPQILALDMCFGSRAGGRLVSVAGLHVYSTAYGVAAPGAVATHPDFRRGGHCSAAMAALCKKLRTTVENVGLNVRADNTPAFSCYQKLGFEIVGAYEDCTITTV